MGRRNSASGGFSERVLQAVGPGHRSRLAGLEAGGHYTLSRYRLCNVRSVAVDDRFRLACMPGSGFVQSNPGCRKEVSSGTPGRNSRCSAGWKCTPLLETKCITGGCYCTEPELRPIPRTFTLPSIEY